MLSWSLIFVGAIALPCAAPGAERDGPRQQAAPVASCRPIDQAGEIRQASYVVEGCAMPLPPGCEAPSVPGCAMPAAPVCCQPVPSCAQPVVPGCAQPMQSYPYGSQAVNGGWGQPVVNGIQCGNGDCRCGRDDCPCGCNSGCGDRLRNRCAWSHAHTTGDLYPHYPYFPQDHGHYYFRPYNAVHVDLHRSQVMGLGGDPRAPYSVSMFDRIYDAYYQQYPPMPEPPAGSVMPFGSSLPNLEELLQQGE